MDDTLSFPTPSDNGVLALRGELDLQTGPELIDTVIALLERGVQISVVDFADLAFVDAAGLGSLVAITQLIRRHHSGSAVLTLRDVPPNVRRILELTDLVGLFDVEDARAA